MRTARRHTAMLTRARSLWQHSRKAGGGNEKKKERRVYLPRVLDKRPELVHKSSRQKSGTDPLAPREENMRTLCLSIAAVSTFLSASCLPNRADAITLGGASVIRPALADIAVTYPTHCRPGRVHHRHWPYDGCAQGYVSPYSSPSYYHYRRGRSSDSSKHNGISPNSVSKSGSMGGHGGSGGGGSGRK